MGTWHAKEILWESKVDGGWLVGWRYAAVAVPDHTFTPATSQRLQTSQPPSVKGSRGSV